MSLEAHHMPPDGAGSHGTVHDAVGGHAGRRGDPFDRLRHDKVAPGHVAQVGTDQDNRPRREGGDRLQDVLQAGTGEILDLDRSRPHGELLARLIQPDPIGGRHPPDHDRSLDIGLEAARQVERLRPANVEPCARDVGIEPKVGGGLRVHAHEDDGRVREEVLPVAQGDAERTAGERHDQVDGTGGVLPLEQRAQLGLGLIAAEEGEVQIFGVEGDRDRRSGLDRRSKHRVDSLNGRGQSRRAEEEEHPAGLPRAVRHRAGVRGRWTSRRGDWLTHGQPGPGQEHPERQRRHGKAALETLLANILRPLRHPGQSSWRASKSQTAARGVPRLPVGPRAYVSDTKWGLHVHRPAHLATVSPQGGHRPRRTPAFDDRVDGVIAGRRRRHVGRVARSNLTGVT